MRTVLLLFAMASLMASSYAAAKESTAPSQASVRNVDLRHPDASASELERRGDEARVAKAYANAIEYYRAALTMTYHKPLKGVLHNKIGIVELQMQYFHEAQKEFQRALKEDRHYAEAYNNLGAALHLQKEYGKAVKQYKKALKLRDDASFHNNLATAYFMGKNINLAVEEYRRALELDPSVFEHSSQRGISAQLASPENRAHYSFLLAKLFAQSGDLDRSIQYLRKAIEDGYQPVDNVYKDSDFAALRSDPRFDDLMKNKPVAIPQ